MNEYSFYIKLNSLKIKIVNNYSKKLEGVGNERR